MCPTAPVASVVSRTTGRAAAILERVTRGLDYGMSGPSAPPSTALVPADWPISPPTARSHGRAAPAAPSPSEDRSPSPPRGKRPRAEAPPFRPSGARLEGSPPPDSRPACTSGAVFHEPLAARRRSHALASIRPARLDELLSLQSEGRCLNLCIRGVTDAASESLEELQEVVEGLLERLVG